MAQCPTKFHAVLRGLRAEGQALREPVSHLAIELAEVLLSEPKYVNIARNYFKHFTNRRQACWDKLKQRLRK